MPWRGQTNDDKTYVGVYCGESEDDEPRIDRDSGREVFSEFIIQDKETGDHVHIGLDEYGDTIFESRGKR